jgi:AraC-like DNA-binding protein
MDFLSPLFARFALHARVFYSGQLCNNVNFHRHPSLSYLHVLRGGRLTVTHGKSAPLELTEPTLLFYSRADRHGFRVRDAGAELVCASVEFGAALGNPILRGLPDLMIVSLAKMPGIAATLDLLFAEAFDSRAGRSAAVDRLAEYFVVLLLRHAIEARLLNSGTLAALADIRLAKSIHAMHERPEHDWSVERLAATAGMSRARYAELFRAITGLTPMDYLTDWRIGVTQTLLKRGQQLKLVAAQVGYANPAALSRVFAQRVGASPAKWLAAHSPVDLSRVSPYVSSEK